MNDVEDDVDRDIAAGGLGLDQLPLVGGAVNQHDLRAAALAPPGGRTGTVPDCAGRGGRPSMASVG
ncbi:hypothetical protein JS756_32365 [Streptomyces actuosus]|uniref:Uncharacterized protein n=1 Tax=Streptomyces actuosus TaxID=1885 RepID=A0ABS2VZW7_STRAS|nr:hypothetical protein [Streptomyces actuosus]MBN0048703.1 hypothetical protein [Streptomyces actuosus]